MRMKVFLALLWAIFLVSRHSCGAASAANEKTLVVVGAGECADCEEHNIKSADVFSGMSVAIDCKFRNGHFKTRGVGKLDKDGKFQVELPTGLVNDKGELAEECYAQLHTASHDPCPARNGIELSKIILKSKENGVHTFGVPKKVAFAASTCASAFLLPHPHKHFFPWHKPFPKFPFPPKKFPPLPPKVFPPPPPEVSPPPPVFPPPKPPKLSPPPSVPKPKPPPKPPKVLPPPVKVCPPLPPVTIPPIPKIPPVYKKPLPPVPKIPPYKKPLPPIPKFPPVYKKPLPPVPKFPPVYKKPLPPLPKMPPIYKKPLPPLPQIPPIRQKPLPPLPKMPPIYKKPLPPFPKIHPFHKKPFPPFPPYGSHPPQS